VASRLNHVPDRVMFVQLKSGHNTDKAPPCISTVHFNRSWKTASWHGKTLRRWPGMFDANSYVETNEEYWISGPDRDQRKTLYSSIRPTIDDDARGAYVAFLDGAPLPGREEG
jgi:hypothetical protein